MLSHYRSLISLWNKIDKRRQLHLGLLLILMLLGSISEAISIGSLVPFLTILSDPTSIADSRLLNKYWPNYFENINYPLILTIFFIVANITSGLIRIILLFVQIRLGYAIGADLSYEIYRRSLYQSYAVHTSTNSSELIAGITGKINNLISNVVLPSIGLVSSVIFMIFICGILLYINIQITLYAFSVFFIIYFLIMRCTRNRITSYSHISNNKQGQIIKYLQEGFGGIRDVLLDHTQEIYCNQYKLADSPLRKAQANIQIIGQSPRYIVEAIGVSAIGLFAYFYTNTGGSDPSSFISLIPVIGVLALSAQRLLPIVQQAYSSLVSIRGSEAISIEVLRLLNQPMPEDWSSDQKLLHHMPFKVNIKFTDVSFRYPGNSGFSLEGVNFQIDRGDKVGFIGETGGGKSTLIDIMMALLPPTSGSFLVDEKTINTHNHGAWQKNIAHVPQSIFLVDGTIAENIAFGILPQDIDYVKLKRVSQMACISEHIDSLKYQYETYVGERGIRLSGGQRQRIGIARALYKEAHIYFLDEATSALDQETEMQVMKSFDSLGKNATIIMVAHRISSLAGCNKIFRIAKGRLSHVGSFKELEIN
jgi:ABC-type multidrug transport system fused ATPase/permease subunit